MKSMRNDNLLTFALLQNRESVKDRQWVNDDGGERGRGEQYSMGQNTNEGSLHYTSEESKSQCYKANYSLDLSRAPSASKATLLI